MRTRVIGPPIELTKADWIEIYYALWAMAHDIEGQGMPGLEDDDMAAWVAELRSIMRKIGGDGRDAYWQGTVGGDKCSSDWLPNCMSGSTATH